MFVTWLLLINARPLCEGPHAPTPSQICSDNSVFVAELEPECYCCMLMSYVNTRRDVKHTRKSNRKNLEKINRLFENGLSSYLLSLRIIGSKDKHPRNKGTSECPFRCKTSWIDRIQRCTTAFASSYNPGCTRSIPTTATISTVPLTK